jgi:hypothetical protein
MGCCGCRKLSNGGRGRLQLAFFATYLKETATEQAETDLIWFENGSDDIGEVNWSAVELIKLGVCYP